MSTVFTLNPIKLNIISTKNTIKKTVVFIGIVPNEVKNELMKIESSGKYDIKNKNLIKFYGKKWYIRIGLKKSLIEGGDEFSFDDESNEQIDDVILDISKNTDSNDQFIVENELKQIKEGTNHSNINEARNALERESSYDKENMISLEELDEIEEQNTPNIYIDDIKPTLISQITQTDGKLKITFIFDDPYISIYPEDKILEFKKKIYAILEIPIFRQHIWYVYQGRTYSLNYSIFDNNSLLYINVQNMLSKYNSVTAPPDLIEGIPVDARYYQKKTFLKVVAHDTFSIMDDYYHKYGITEFNLLDLEDFISPSRKLLVSVINDKYQLELIYYGFIILYWPMLSLQAFSDYIKLPSNIIKYYPELQQPVQELVQLYKLEKKIIDEKIDLITNPKKKEDLKKLRGAITNSITESIISVLKYQNSKSTIVFIRNLFDRFQLSENIIGIKCYITHNGKKIILNKSYKGHGFIKEIINMDSIVFKIVVDTATATAKTINLELFKNGNYVIKSTWLDENQYDFDDVFNICLKLTTPIIDKINSLGSCVLALKKTLPIMNKNNSKFTEIGMSMFYKKSFTETQFGILKNIMADYRKAGIIKDRLVEKSTVEYYFSKGMYQFKADRIERVITVNNYYDFLTDGITKHKWFSIFEKTRITKLHHRVSDIKIEIKGIKENEFFIFYNFILTLFYLFNKKDIPSNTDKKENNQLSAENKLKKILRDLKEQDPVLYKFKKKNNVENVYSKICQKPYQPMLLNKQGYDALPTDKKNNAIKYWNFTTNKDAYYTCPNPKYPHIKFIVKRHPNDYCIPCCKKTQITQNTKDAKKIIYDICMNDHKYEKIERTITLGSRYIMSYGKDVEPGRLSRLPENSLEPLFYETYSVKDQGVDQECMTTDGYYLYGVDQNIKNISNVGILIILIHATDTNIQDFINKIINLLKISPNKFRILLDGEIGKYFKNLTDFIDQVQLIFFGNGLVDNTYTSMPIPWNEIFINIAYLFLNINVIYFQHNTHDSIKLILPSYITNKDQFVSSDFTNLLILQKRKKFYPIYLLNTDVFFKVKMINQKLFNFNDSIIVIISRLVSAHFDKKIKQNITDNITLAVIQSFVQDSDYKINKLFVNSSNMCYYIHITQKNKNIYIPIDLSYHVTSSKINITYEMFLRSKSNMDISVFMSFVDEFNYWIAKKSEKACMTRPDVDKKLPLEQRVQPIHPYIKIYNWLVLANVNQTINNDSIVIGFMAHNINYYVNNIKLSAALKIKNAPVIQVFYDPDVINKDIYAKSKAISDNRCKTIGKSIYKSNLYQLLLLEFMTVFNGQKNIDIRKKIKQKLLGNFNKDFNDLMNDISKIVTDHGDYDKIKTQICEFVNSHHSKFLLFHEIDDSFYKFDRELFECIKKLPTEKIYKELEKISSKFVIHGDVSSLKDFEFPNMFTTCQNKNNEKYCKNNKLIIDKNTLKKLLEILTADLLNPVKEKWIFSSIFSDNVINFFKFIKRPDELITIEIVD